MVWYSYCPLKWRVKFFQCPHSVTIQLFSYEQCILFCNSLNPSYLHAMWVFYTFIYKLELMSPSLTYLLEECLGNHVLNRLRRPLGDVAFKWPNMFLFSDFLKICWWYTWLFCNSGRTINCLSLRKINPIRAQKKKYFLLCADLIILPKHDPP